MNSVDYNSYLAYGEAEKIELFDKGVPLSLFQTEKSKRMFLRELIEKNDNNFLRKKAVENIALMCILGESKNSNTALSVLLDIEDDDEPFVLTTKIKFLFLLNEKLELNNQNIIEQIDKLRFHNNGDVASEATYHMGLNHLLIANITSDQDSFFKRIEEAKFFFSNAKTSSENRLDAALLMEICNLIHLAILKKTDNKSKCVATIENILAERHHSYIYSKIPSFELWIYKIVSKISSIVCNTPNEWLDIKSEVNDICCFHYNIVDIELKSGKYPDKTKFTEAMNNFVLLPFYKESLNQHLAAIKRLNRETKNNPQLKEFCNYLIKSIEDNDSLKKKLNFNIVAEFANAFPCLNQEKLQREMQSHDLSDPVSVAKLFGRYVDEQYPKYPTLVTGSHVGDEIFNNLIQKLNSFVPNYPHSKFLEFQTVLSDIIRYTLVAVSQKTSGGGFFKFLFDNNASENDLQESIYAYLTMNSEFGSRYKKEVTEVADGGRVDVLYISDKVTIPVELKKTDYKPSADSISKNYLAQTQTYCYPYDQLGLFVLLDNSKKADELQSPINDIRELFDIQHMEPYYKVENKFPNYVVTIIVPGNKVTPSSRSRYK